MAFEVDEQALAADAAQLAEQPVASEETPTVENFSSVDGKINVPLNAEFGVKHNGQLVNTPLEKIINHYRQGLNYEDKFKAFNESKQKFETERGDFDQFNSLKEKFGGIQDWSEKNPQDWERLYDMFKNKEQYLLGNQQPGENTQLVNQIATQQKAIDELLGKVSTFEQAQEQTQQQRDMQEVEKEIAEVKKEFGERINLDEKEIDGTTLRDRIISWGIENKMPTFKAAFNSFPGIMSKLLETAASTGRNEVVKGIKSDAKEGVVARSSTPFGQGETLDPKKLSEDQLLAAANAEFEQLMSKGGQ